VTLGNYYEGLFKLFASILFASSNGTTDTYRSLHAAPDPKMRLTKQVLRFDAECDQLGGTAEAVGDSDDDSGISTGFG
jgi:hypothetical protein